MLELNLHEGLGRIIHITCNDDPDGECAARSRLQVDFRHAVVDQGRIVLELWVFAVVVELHGKDDEVSQHEQDAHAATKTRVEGCIAIIGQLDRYVKHVLLSDFSPQSDAKSSHYSTLLSNLE